MHVYIISADLLIDLWHACRGVWLLGELARTMQVACINAKKVL